MNVAAVCYRETTLRAESEDKAEIDRFCDALIAIRQEIKSIVM